VTSPRPRDGYFFEDYSAGMRMRHATPRTLTDGDAALYIALTGARQPLHCSRPLAYALGHRACPLDDLLVFNVAFGKTVPDVSYNAVANLGYADVRFMAPVYPGDTLECASEVIGTKANSNGKSGIVYVRSRATNHDGVEVLTWIRWVMVARRRGGELAQPVLPDLPRQVDPSQFRIPPMLNVAGLQPHATGGDRCWDDYQAGEVIDHPGAMTIEEADHMMATRLYQNPARVHFDAAASASGKRLVYGGHVISLCRALSHDGLENAFAIAAIHGGTHAHPTFAGDTLRCRHVVLARDEIGGRRDLGALRMHMLAIKNVPLAQVAADAPVERNPAVVLDLDYSVLIPRRQNP